MFKQRHIYALTKRQNNFENGLTSYCTSHDIRVAAVSMNNGIEYLKKYFQK